MRHKYKSEYDTWVEMKQRCYNKNNVRYWCYGGRGIDVCERWLNSFTNFIEDMGPRPKDFQLERIDNDEGYYPWNCKWATRSEQNKNKSYKSKNPFYIPKYKRVDLFA